MGLRIDIKDGAGNSFYGTKLYGYCDEEGCKSFQYLVEIGKFDGDEIFCGCCNENPILLNAEQFCKFIKLYSDDLDMVMGTMDTPLIEEEAIKKLLSTQNDKHIEWS